MIEWMILLVISHQCHSVLMHHSAIFILRTESYKTIAMHCRQKTICISASFPPFFMILIVFNSQEAHLSNGIRTRKNGYVLAEIWSAQAESKKHCNSFVRHCISGGIFPFADHRYLMSFLVTSLLVDLYPCRASL